MEIRKIEVQPKITAEMPKPQVPIEIGADIARVQPPKGAKKEATATRYVAGKPSRVEHTMAYRAALELFLSGQFDIKDIAEMVGVTEATIHAWRKIKDSAWDKLAAAHLRPTMSRVLNIERQMDVLEDSVLDDTESVNRVWSNKDADIYIKLVSARAKLAATSISQHVQFIKDVSDYAVRNMPESAPDIAACLQGYLGEIVSKSKQ